MVQRLQPGRGAADHPRRSRGDPEGRGHGALHRRGRRRDGGQVMGRVAGKKVLITGAAGGLGQAMARMLAGEGARVAVTDVNLAGARALADAINADHPGAAFAYAHDVASEEQWIEVVARAVAAMGGLSVLVNNAGVGGPLSFVEQDTAENWRRQYEINLLSVMLGCKHAMPHLRAAAPASIVNISSIAGLAAAPGM